MARGVSTDSRTIQAGNLFVALTGENFDGHNFIQDAISKGASGVMISKHLDVGSNIPVIHSNDTLYALGELARSWRRRFDIPLIAITGSVGKTTTKEMAASILSAHFNPILKTEGNLNNLIGLPQTLFQLDPIHKVAVVEMGMSMRGEIRRLAEIASPNIAAITNVSPVHLEFLKTIEQVAQAKGELLEKLSEADIAVLNADDPRVSAMRLGRSFRTVMFGEAPDVDVRIEKIILRGFEGTQVILSVSGKPLDLELSIPGKFHVHNAAAATAIGYALNLPFDAIVKGLGDFRPAAMRTRIYDLFGIKIIDDSYNASPRSMDAAISLLMELMSHSGGRGIAVLADMLELGDESVAAHRRLGRHVAKAGVHELYLFGSMAQKVAEGALEEKMPDEAVHIYENHAQIVAMLREVSKKGDVILIKGSRGMRMERVVRGLRGEVV